MTRRHLILLLRLLVGVGLLVWGIRRVDWSPASALDWSSFDAPLLLAAVVSGGLSVLGWALRWHLFLRMAGVRPAFGETLRLTLFADFFNLWFLGPLGADGIRLLLLSRRFTDKKAAIGVSILLDHISGLFGSAILYFFFTRPQSEWLVADGAFVPKAVLLTTDWALGVFGIITFMGIGFVNHVWLHQAVARWPGCGWITGVMRHFDFIRHHRLLLLGTQVVSLVTLLFNYMAYWAAGAAAGLHVPAPQLLAIMPMVDVITSLPITISGIGVRENLFIELLGRHFAFGSEGALTLSLLGFIAVGLWGLIGGLWLALHRRRTGLHSPVEGTPVSEPLP